MLLSWHPCEAARLDVEFTEVRAPISGRVSRRLVTEGNLINGGVGTQGTLLTSIVSLDPVYAYFDADERSYLKYARLGMSGERPSSRDVRNPVRIGLADEEGFPHEGHMDFVDNEIDECNVMTPLRSVSAELGVACLAAEGCTACASSGAGASTSRTGAAARPHACMARAMVHTNV